MRLLYFGWVRAKIGVSGETIEPPDGVDNVGALIDWLCARGGGYGEALEDSSAIRVAVNQELAEFDAAIADGDEVALFPPMTGG